VALSAAVEEGGGSMCRTLEMPEDTIKVKKYRNNSYRSADYTHMDMVVTME
jgi:hypothetical protein